MLCRWIQGKAISMRFGVPMVWREPKNHHVDCYFCKVDMTGWNQHKKKDWYYPEIESVRQPVPHCNEGPVPVFMFLPNLTADETLLEAMEDRNSSCSNYSSTSMADEASSLSTNLKPFSQGQLNDLVRDLNLSKESSELLAARLGEHSVLDSGTKITFYRNRDNLLLRFFSMEYNFVFCNSIPGLLAEKGLSKYNSDEWRLLIDSSKRSLKCELLHKSNKFACVPIGHSMIVKEHFLKVKIVLNKLGYSEHNWAICVDFRMVNFLLGQQGEYTKYPCFLSYWDSRPSTQHWVKRIGRRRKILQWVIKIS